MQEAGAGPKGALVSQEGTEQAGTAALPLLHPLLSQGERGETGPPGPAGFAGPPVSTPVDPPCRPLHSGQLLIRHPPEGTLHPVGRYGQNLKKEMVSSLLSTLT